MNMYFTAGVQRRICIYVRGCMYVCMHACMCACMCVCMYICADVYVSLCVYGARMYVHIGGICL